MRKLLALALLASACAHAPPPPPPAPPLAAPKPVELTAAEEARLGHTALLNGAWDEARQHLEASLQKEPKNAAAWLDAGWVAEERKDLKGAQAAYAKVLELDPGQLPAALNLARISQPEEAERVLRAALRVKQEEPRLLDALAAAQRSQKKLDEAEETVQRVLARHPRDADAYRNLAAIESDRGRLRLAESALNSARKLDGKDAGLLNSLGLLALRRDDTAAARDSFEEAVKLDPQLAPAWANLGALALRYRDYAAAEASYAKAVALDGSRWEAHLAHGWALEGLKRPKDARAEYEKVLALQPAQEDALYGRAVALRAEGDLPGAMQAFQEYAADGKGAHLKEAQGQIAQIDRRLKNPPAQLKQAVKPAPEMDLTRLPQGTDTAPAAELPQEEPPAQAAPAPDPAAPAPGAPPAAPAAPATPGQGPALPEKPAAGTDGGVDNPTTKAAAR